MSPSLDIEIYFCTIFSLKYIIFKIYQKQKSKEKFFQKSGHFAAVGCHILLITRAQQMTSLKDFQHFDDILVAQNHIICHIWCSAVSQMYIFARSKLTDIVKVFEHFYDILLDRKHISHICSSTGILMTSFADAFFNCEQQND